MLDIQVKWGGFVIAASGSEALALPRHIRVVSSVPLTPPSRENELHRTEAEPDARELMRVPPPEQGGKMHAGILKECSAASEIRHAL